MTITLNLFQQVVLSLLLLLGFWKLGELVITRVIVPMDRWQAERQISRERRAEWAGKRRRLE